MKYIEESLSSDEEVLALFRPHGIVRVGIIIIAVLSIFTLGLALPVAIFLWLRLKFLEMGLTNKRVIVKRGIIGRSTDEMKLTSIETVEVRQGIAGRIFGFGNIRITGRGISDVVFGTVADPLAVKRQIESVSNPLS